MKTKMISIRWPFIEKALRALQNQWEIADGSNFIVKPSYTSSTFKAINPTILLRATNATFFAKFTQYFKEGLWNVFTKALSVKTQLHEVRPFSNTLKCILKSCLPLWNHFQSYFVLCILSFWNFTNHFRTCLTTKEYNLLETMFLLTAFFKNHFAEFHKRIDQNAVQLDSDFTMAAHLELEKNLIQLHLCMKEMLTLVSNTVEPKIIMSLGDNTYWCPRVRYRRVARLLRAMKEHFREVVTISGYLRCNVIQM